MDEIRRLKSNNLYLYSLKPEKECKNCGVGYKSRSGRGLCRICWEDKSIRNKYHKLATFGGNVHIQMQDFLTPELL